ncbi:hypothetical protein M8C21_027625 [Ambrosia artemisiifolia]|uniref:Uncharacterized protein n=1 Tax=Ambrosia artemisiifolia TaxID=4212 RepID=A0AAD5BW18_AMBAR|nr:hypothetical protein M8C21_027625 [Ambrosia artemisiifolia]
MQSMKKSRFCNRQWLLLRMMVSKWWCDIGVLMASWCWYEVGGYCALDRDLGMLVGAAVHSVTMQAGMDTQGLEMSTYIFCRFTCSAFFPLYRPVLSSQPRTHHNILTGLYSFLGTNSLILAFFVMRFEHVGSRRNARVIINRIESIVISVFLGHIEDLSHTFGGLHFVTGNANFCHHMKMSPKTDLTSESIIVQ